MILTLKQQGQEEDYTLPYHWFKEPDTAKGRIYFGYFDICADTLKGDRAVFAFAV